MKRPVLVLALGLVIVVGAAALRLAGLDHRPMHCDEANQAIKFGRLLEQGDYVYDPREHHGPSLNFLTLPIAWATSAKKLTEITETHLRLLPAVFGILLVVLVWPLRDPLGRPAAIGAAVLTAVSPAMVFYSRYYIHEMLLVGFTFGGMVALWRYTWDVRGAPTVVRRSAEPARALSGSVSLPSERHLAPRPDGRAATRRSWFPRACWLVFLGACVGMMHATKETCVIPLCAMAVAALATGGLGRNGLKRGLLAGLVVMLTAVSVSALFFSSFLDHPAGVIDSYKTYAYYLARASGEGTAGPHEHPWHQYFRILFWWHRGTGPLWTEGWVGAMALAGLVAAVSGKALEPANLPLVRFLSIYTVLTTVVYCALPYKTPWCALGFFHGMLLLAGVGAAVLLRAAPGCVLKAAVAVVLAAATGHLAWQAHRASFVAYEDPSNPYVYAHTTSDVPLLARRVEEIAAVHPDGKAMHIQVVCPEGDYWPLPWYLRDFARVGWFDEVPGVRSEGPVDAHPTGPAAPLIITQPAIKEAVLEYVYAKQPPGQRPLRELLRKHHGADWRLRPGVRLLVIARRDLLEAFRRRDRVGGSRR